MPAATTAAAARQVFSLHQLSQQPPILRDDNPDGLLFI
jgi:hypothetical protein